MTAQRPFEIGLFTFGEITADPVTGRPINPAVRLREFDVSDDVPSRVRRPPKSSANPFSQ
jgi:hypothetical protein